MKLWGRHQSEPAGIEAEEDAVRRLVGRPAPPSPPSASYWSTLAVRVNGRIDSITSPLALSLAWAWRVAIPGVIAVVSFLVGLRYYVPAPDTGGADLASVVSAMEQTEVDSVVASLVAKRDSHAGADLVGDPFKIQDDAIREYLLATTGSSAALESLTDDEIESVLRTLSTMSLTL